MEQLNATIKVVAIFHDGMLRPHLFNWEGRTYKVTELHSYYQAKAGRAILYHWTVSACLPDRQAAGNTYALQWNNHTLEWQLTGVDEAPDAQSSQSWRRYQQVNS